MSSERGEDNDEVNVAVRSSHAHPRASTLGGFAPLPFSAQAQTANQAAKQQIRRRGAWRLTTRPLRRGPS
eukprot:5478948-Pyramimonas_sp.AAC.2